MLGVRMWGVVDLGYLPVTLVRDAEPFGRICLVSRGSGSCMNGTVTRRPRQ